MRTESFLPAITSPVNRKEDNKKGNSFRNTGYNVLGARDSMGLLVAPAERANNFKTQNNFLHTDFTIAEPEAMTKYAHDARVGSKIPGRSPALSDKSNQKTASQSVQASELDAPWNISEYITDCNIPLYGQFDFYPDAGQVRELKR